MFLWNFILRNLFTSTSPQAQRPRPPVKLGVEVLEDRKALSASTPDQDANVQPPHPQPVIAAMVQQEVRALEAEQSVLNDFVTIAMQDVAQLRARLVQEYAGLYKDINGILNPSNGSGAATAAPNAPPQQPNIALQQTGSATTSHENAPTEGAIKPMVDGGGAQPDAGGGGGAGGNPNATVSGQVWLDNNGDGLENNGELGFSGITVYLQVQNQETMTTTTDANGDHDFAVYVPPGTKAQCTIQVVIPQFDEATIEGPDSDINAAGVSPDFSLAPGGNADIPAGIRSMHVTTTQDDATAPIQNQITLRDAINTGNNGGGPTVTFAPNVSGNIELGLTEWS